MRQKRHCRLLKRLSEKSSLRHVYIGFDDIQRIIAECPEWYQDMIWVSYIKGMRQGEVHKLRWRHTWKTNARRPGIDSEIRESILGHSDRNLDVSERYGVISDDELVNAIDKFTYDHGLTQILVATKVGK